MDDRKIKNMFIVSDHSLCIDEERRRNALEVLKQEVKSKRVTVMTAKTRIAINQIVYMDKTMLWLQTAGCLVLLLLLAVMNRFKVESEEVIVFATVLSSALSVLSLSGVVRMFHVNITELSESCYFNVSQMITFQMACSGILNLTVLPLMIFMISHQWKIALVQTGLHILVPYVLTQCCCIGILLTETGRRNNAFLLLVGLFTGIFYTVISAIPQIYQASAIGLWGAAFVIGITVLMTQLKILHKVIEKGDIVCMN